MVTLDCCTHCMNGGTTYTDADLAYILVTGSRAYQRDDLIRDALSTALHDLGVTDPRQAVLVDGGNPHGADTMAHQLAVDLGMLTERHPANWDRPCTENCYHRPRRRNGKPYCPVSGNYRNQHMLDLGVDRVLAFPLSLTNRQGGTWDCIHRAQMMKLPLTIIDPDGR